MDDVKPKYAKCKNYGCGIEAPIGYLSIRGHCATCEFIEGTRARATVSALQKRIDSIRELAFPGPEGRK